MMMVAQPPLVETTGKLSIAVLLCNKTIYIYYIYISNQAIQGKCQSLHINSFPLDDISYKYIFTRQTFNKYMV